MGNSQITSLDDAAGVGSVEGEDENVQLRAALIETSVYAAKLEAQLARANAALRTIAEWPFDIRGDCVADARKLAQLALSPAAPAEEVK